MTGLKPRTVTAHAARGLIPSARQFGAKWTFHHKTIRAWIEEDEKWQTTCSSAAKPGTSGFRSTDAEIRESLGTTSRKVAEKRKNQRIRELLASAGRGELTCTFAEAMEKFTEALESENQFDWAEKTRKRYWTSARQLTRVVDDIMYDNDRDIAQLKVHEIDVPMVADIVQRRKDQASVATTNRDLTALGHFFLFCRNKNWIEANPLRSYEKQGMKETLPFIEMPTDAATVKMIARGPYTFGCLIKFIDNEGTRALETAMLEWKHVTFDPGDPTRAEILLVHTKGGEPRAIEAHPETVAMLHAMPRSNQWPYVFFNTGKHGWYSDLSTRFWIYAEDVGFEGRLHDLRHRFAVRKLKDDWSIYRVSRHLGHKSVLTTERYYLRYLTQEQQDRVRRSGNNGLGDRR